MSDSYLRRALDTINNPASTLISPRLRTYLEHYNAVNPEHVPALRAIYRDIYPSMSADQLNKVVQFSSKYVGHKMNDKFTAVKNSSLAQTQAVRDLSVNDRDVFTEFADIAKQNDMGWNVSANGASTQQQGKPILRSRYVLPGEDTLKESKEQQTFDTSQAEMFAWHGSDLGISSLDLENRRNQALRFMKPFETRPNFDQSAIPFPIPWQFKQIDKGLAGALLEEKYINAAHEIMVKHLPPAFTVMGDTQFPNAMPETSPGPEDTPLTSAPRAVPSPYTPVVQLPAGYSADPSYALPMGFANYMGFKLDRPDYWRQPLHPKASPTIFPFSLGQASGQVYY